MNRDIYLDNGATTPPDPDILQGMFQHHLEIFGNPGSGHRVGHAAKALLETARQRTAEAMGGRASEVIFTGGGTEANALAILGLAGDTPADIAISAVEHACTKEAAKYLKERFNWTVNVIPVDAVGRVTPDGLAGTLTRNTRIVAIMMANNEVGTINDISALSRVVRTQSPRAKFVVDAVQGFGKIPFSVRRLDVDAIAVTAHKLHGPKGIGALWTPHPIRPVFKGGGQENGRRGGTPSPPLAWALSEAFGRQVADNERIQMLRDRLWAHLENVLPQVSLNGAPLGHGRIGNHLHIHIPDIPTEPLINALSADRMYVSGGSACSTGAFSAVLTAMGRRKEEGAFIRLTLGRFSTDEDVPEAAGRLANAVNDLRVAYA